MKTFEVSTRILVFATLNVCANSEAEARIKASERVRSGEFDVQSHTAEIDAIEHVNLIDEEGEGDE